jgi:hypothetical protein
MGIAVDDHHIPGKAGFSLLNKERGEVGQGDAPGRYSLKGAAGRSIAEDEDTPGPQGFAEEPYHLLQRDIGESPGDTFEHREEIPCLHRLHLPHRDLYHDNNHPYRL